MVNECLVTKLKSVVNNDSLEILGTIELDVIPMTITSGEQQQKMSIGTQEGEVVVTVSDGGYYATTLAGLDVEGSRLTSYTVPASETGYAYPLYFKNDSYKIRIKSKYKVYRIALPDATSGHIININVDKIHDCYDLVSLKSNTSKMYGDIAILASCPISTFAAYGCAGLYGDIKNLNQAKSLNIYGTGISGNIADLNSSIVEFEGSRCSGITGNINVFKNATVARVAQTNISGSIQSLVETAWEGGRRNGTLTVNIADSQIQSMSGVVTNTPIIITFTETSATVKNQGGEVKHTYNGTWS
jgi:hypothetical protein